MKIERSKLEKIIQKYKRKLCIRMPVELGPFGRKKIMDSLAESEEKDGVWIIYLEKRRTYNAYVEDIIFELLQCKFRKLADTFENLMEKFPPANINSFWRAWDDMLEYFVAPIKHRTEDTEL